MRDDEDTMSPMNSQHLNDLQKVPFSSRLYIKLLIKEKGEENQEKKSEMKKVRADNKQDYPFLISIVHTAVFGTTACLKFFTLRHR